MGTLVEAYRIKEEDINAAWTQLYEGVFSQIPEALIPRTVQRVVTTRKWFPKPAELLADAEAVRLAVKASIKFVSCESCSKDGWEAVTRDGVTRMERCSCWHAHQARVAALGAGDEPLALPEGRDEP